MTAERTCRVCGCTEDNACLDEKTGHGCRWVAKNLCNVCDDRAGAIKLTVAQQAQVAILATGGAYTRQRGYFGTDVRPVAIARLQSQGLADKRTAVKHRQQRTYYWLTPLGREVARRRA